MAPSTAASMSASGRTMLALFPPSSRLTRFIVSAAAFRTALPVGVLPVNAMRSTFGWLVRSSPTRRPGATITLMTPFGMRVWVTSSARRSADSGVSGDGLRTIVLPVAVAIVIFHTAMSSGKFQGMIPTHTPMGSRRT